MPMPNRVVVLSLVALTSTIAGCQRKTSEPPPSSSAEARDLERVVLDEKGAFPLSAHVESADLASGAWGFERTFKAGDDLFHTAFNGLDGVGSFVRPDGTNVARFAPLGPKGPSAQSCAECHSPQGGVAHNCSTCHSYHSLRNEELAAE